MSTSGVLHPVQGVREGKASWNKGPYCLIWAFKPQAALSVPLGGGERLKELGRTIFPLARMLETSRTFPCWGEA